MKTVTIAIPSLHRPDLTARCIEFIQKQTLPADAWEIIVVENEALPGAILPDPLPLNTRRIELATNEGTTGSINRAVAASASRYVLLLNNDVELARDYLEKLVAVLDADRKLGFATGKLLRATQRTHLDGAGDAMLVGGGSYRLGNMDLDEGQFDHAAPVLAGCGAAVLYNREAFVEAGGLDTDFFAYLDDVDLGLRVQLAGYGGMYVPSAVGYHIGSATFGDELHPKVIELLTRNQIYLMMKNYPSAVFARMLPRIAAYQTLWMGLATRRRNDGTVPYGSATAYWRGVRDGLRGWRLMRRKYHDLRAKRRISHKDFLARLRASERQIYDWQQSRDPAQRSSLLRWYFRLFGRP